MAFDSFDPTVAKLTVELSRIAYQEGSVGEGSMGAVGLGEFRFFDDGVTTQLFTATNLETRVVAFRGTESSNPRDWLTDSRFRPVPGPLGTVHSGFSGALDVVWDDLTTHIGGDSRHLVITGHSLGGGLALVAAARLAAAGAPPAAVYVYGCPRVGLRDFRDAYDAVLGRVTYRIINHIDLVTRVPLLVQGYRAPGRRMYFDEGHDFHEDAGAWQIAKDDLTYRAGHWGRIESLGLGTHEIGQYIARVDSL